MKKTVDSQKADSLAYFFEKANNDTVPYAKRQLYNKKAIAIISKDKNDSMNRVNYFKVANRYFNMNANDDFKKITLFIMENSRKAGDTIGLAKAYSYLGNYYSKEFISDSAYLSYFKSEKLYKYLRDNSKIAKTLIDKCTLQFNEKDYIGCEKSAFDALKFLRKTNDPELTYEVYNILGVIYNELGEYDKSIEFHKKALDLLNANKASSKNQSQATSLNNIGLIYQNQKKHKEAINYFNKAYHADLLNKNPFLYVALKDNIGYSKFKIGDFKDLPKMFYEALRIGDSLKMIPIIVSNKLHLSEYYALQKDTLKAKKFGFEAYTLAKKSNLTKDILLSLKQLSNVDPKKTIKYSEEYLRIIDSLQLAERKIRNKFARIEFETEELAIEKNKLTEQKSILIYIAIGILLLAISAFVIRYQITRNKELKLLRQQQNANEEIYKLMLDQQQKIEEGKQLEKKRISRELHDGVMGRLSGIRLNLFILNKKTDPETISKCLEHIGEIQNIEKEIKSIAYDLEKNVFSDTVGFVSIVKNLFRDIEGHSGIHFKLEVDGNIEWEVLGGNHKMNIYRILQESLQNINKYANAKNVALKIHKTKDAITIAIEDDGIGFDTQKIKKGLGLKNMEERANEMNGKISIHSVEGRGTKINLTIPI